MLLNSQTSFIRYYEAYKKRAPFLFFLTLDGTKSQHNSSETTNYKTLSYKENIINWLLKCKEKAVDSPVLRETIKQYINLIKKLTNQNLNRKMNEDIINRVLKDQDSFKAFTSLVNTKKDLIEYSVKDKIVPLLEKISEESNLKLERDIPAKGKSALFKFSDEKLTGSNLVIFFSLENSTSYSGFTFGFRYLNKEADVVEDLRNFIRNDFKEKFGFTDASAYSLCYKHYKEYSDWENLKTMEKILFSSDEFENDIKDKVIKMYTIFKNSKKND
ncbi:MAG: hypothetical protein U5L09_01765 [Bacteroidales bacterium]|nr:hypothetical protein [Bacteroidales bacterium]